MKRALLILVVLFASVSGSFAWSGGQTLYVDGMSYTDTQSMTVNLNAYSANVELSGSVADQGFASLVFVGNNYDYYYTYDFSHDYPNGTTPYIYYRVTSYGDPIYWSSIYVNFEAWLTYGSVTLKWE
ncbi:hypothetical protein [Mucilaginibacter paludis]|uniref:Uncharacterized protein n=1 Tax=Mucilaginibacter paludis DSM 18603 TaxID=714943 RepID=H1YGC0_9SPHI|nr:hypothetical protein [Mucilaginibacter paludis]EHQ24472.1 hypothetical protein Mucpa_0275 [Mucilaginibacter paludis DSM 18603]